MALYEAAQLANRNHWARAGSGTYASTNAHLGTAGSRILWEPLAASSEQAGGAA